MQGAGPAICALWEVPLSSCSWLWACSAHPAAAPFHKLTLSCANALRPHPLAACGVLPHNQPGRGPVWGRGRGRGRPGAQPAAPPLAQPAPPPPLAQLRPRWRAQALPQLRARRRAQPSLAQLRAGWRAREARQVCWGGGARRSHPCCCLPSGLTRSTTGCAAFSCHRPPAPSWLSMRLLPLLVCRSRSPPNRRRSPSASPARDRSASPPPRRRSESPRRSASPGAGRQPSQERSASPRERSPAGSE